mmetsp:Transcript_19348/g.35578  ORF Transcript_19348/g.35578 Transcript_19348/m.35578 type:complete len:204 (+) Transcript_19348:85-696(+)
MMTFTKLLLVSSTMLHFINSTLTCQPYSVCGEPSDACMNDENFRVCKDLEDSGCTNILVMESCPLQFACGASIAKIGETCGEFSQNSHTCAEGLECGSTNANIPDLGGVCELKNDSCECPDGTIVNCIVEECPSLIVLNVGEICTGNSSSPCEAGLSCVDADNLNKNSGTIIDVDADTLTENSGTSIKGLGWWSIWMLLLSLY